MLFGHPKARICFAQLTAAISGAAVMVIEILGVKILAPYIGVSQFVWIAQITITLIALAVGYALGGYIIDRSPDMKWVYAAIATAGIYLLIVVGLIKPVARFALGFNLPVASLTASTLLFFVPLTFLAMVTPMLVRLLTSSVERVGSKTGSLTALSTLGSVVGTLFIGYLFTPHLPNSLSLYLISSLLLGLSAIYICFWSGVNRPGVLLVLGCILGLGFYNTDLQADTLPSGYRNLYSKNSVFGQIQVIERGNVRIYLNDWAPQSFYDPVRQRSVHLYSYSIDALVKHYAQNPRDILIIGLAGGILPMTFTQSGAHVDVVEINPDAVQVAEKYFDLKSQLMDIHIVDGRFYLNQTKKHYDVIILDAFLGDNLPSHLLSVEAFRIISRVLTQNGVLVINTFHDLDYPFLRSSLDLTLRAVFPHVKSYSLGKDLGNEFHVATKNLFPYENDRIQLFDFPRASAAGVQMTPLPPNLTDGRVLTDDFNPADYFDAPSRQKTRRAIVRWMMR